MVKHTVRYVFPILIMTAVFSPLFFLTACKSYTNIPKTEPGDLIPYAVSDGSGEKLWGYINGKTFEIVIEGKYAKADPFIGNYAVVQKSRNGKRFIIDKNEKVVLSGNFSAIDIIASENGKNHLAILEKKHERTKFDSGLRILSDSVKPHFYKEDHYKFRLINIFDGKTIIPEKENDLPLYIQLVGGYFIAQENLYQFLDNGKVQCVVKNNAALTVSILERHLAECGINAQVNRKDGRITIDYEPYIAAQYANPDLSGAFEALKQMDPPFTVPFARYSPLYRDHRLFLNASLNISERKYVLVFKDEKTRQRAMGIYNESKAEWELFPYFDILKNEETEERERHYITDIMQTNDPDLYRLHLKTDSMDWGDHYYILIAGGIFDIGTGEFIDHLFLSGRVLSFDYYDSPWRLGDVKNVKFPENGVYLFYDENREHCNSAVIYD